VIRGDDPRRFQSYVAVDANGCWIWTGGRTANGYGQFSTTTETGAREHWYAHRWSYTQTFGPIPDGMQLDHLCRVRACCNPSHLEPVTQTVNILRGESPYAKKARQSHCKWGHELTGNNVRVKKNGCRQCRECDRIREKARRVHRPQAA